MTTKAEAIIEYVDAKVAYESAAAVYQEYTCINLRKAMEAAASKLKATFD